jgi:hypothetical protein
MVLNANALLASTTGSGEETPTFVNPVEQHMAEETST